MNHSKKKSASEIIAYNQALRDRFRKIFEDCGFTFLPAEELPKDISNRYKVTFWKRKQILN